MTPRYPRVRTERSVDAGVLCALLLLLLLVVSSSAANAEGVATTRLVGHLVTVTSPAPTDTSSEPLTPALTEAPAPPPTPPPTSPPTPPPPPPTEAPYTLAPLTPAPPIGPNPKALVGVCLVGVMDALSSTYDNLVANFLDALQPDRKFRVVLADLDSRCDSRPDIAACGAVCRRQCKANTRKSMSLLPVLTRLADQVHFDEMMSCEHTRLSHTTFCRAGRRAAAAVAAPDAPPLLARESFEAAARYVCLERLRNHEVLTNTRFDVVAVVRPNVQFLEPVPSGDHIRKMRPRLLLSTSRRPLGSEASRGPETLSDAFWVIPRAILDDFTSALLRVGAPSDDPAPLDLRLARLLDGHQAVPYMVYPFFTAIVHSEADVECDNGRRSAAALRAPHGKGLIDFRTECLRTLGQR